MPLPEIAKRKTGIMRSWTDPMKGSKGSRPPTIRVARVSCVFARSREGVAMAYSVGACCLCLRSDVGRREGRAWMMSETWLATQDPPQAGAWRTRRAWQLGRRGTLRFRWYAAEEKS